MGKHYFIYTSYVSFQVMFKVFAQILKNSKFYTVYLGYIKVTLNRTSPTNKKVIFCIGYKF